MKKQRNTIKEYPIHVGADSISAQKHRGIKNVHGITLIALVITIIVLLILAGITINLTIGEHGIIKMAEKAGKNYVNSAEDEKNKLEGLLNEVQNIINNVGGENESPTTELNILKAGDYIKYDSGANGIITCRVLYPLSSPYGLQIITDKNVGTAFTLGSATDFEVSKANYNDAIKLLNDKAETYINTNYAYDARCVGSVPTVQNGVLIGKGSEQVGPATLQFTTYTGSNVTDLKDEDTNYTTDESQMKSINIWNIGETYWLASRKLYTTEPTKWCNFCIRNVNDDATLGEGGHLLGIGGTTTTAPYLSNPIGFRPCILLKSNAIKITGGDGKSEATAYTLGI